MHYSRTNSLNKSKLELPISKLDTLVDMEWEHKTLCFTITVETIGPLYLASARTPPVNIFRRVRPFSAIGTSEKDAIKLLKDQIKLEFIKIPDFQTS